MGKRQAEVDFSLYPQVSERWRRPHVQLDRAPGRLLRLGRMEDGRGTSRHQQEEQKKHGEHQGMRDRAHRADRRRGAKFTLHSRFKMMGRLANVGTLHRQRQTEQRDEQLHRQRGAFGLYAGKIHAILC